MGELLEDGVLRVGVSGTLVSMCIGPRACLLAWRLGGFKGPGAGVSGSRVTLGTCSGLSVGIRLELRLMRDMTNPLAVHMSSYAVKLWSFLPFMLTLCDVSEWMYYTKRHRYLHRRPSTTHAPG